MVVETSARKWGRVAEYVCAKRRATGGCTNALRTAGPRSTRRSRRLLRNTRTPEAVEAVIGLTERDDARERQELLVREHATLGRQMPG